MNHDRLYTPMSPERAERILNRNTINRSLRAGLVERIARDIRNGNWKQNGATIRIAESGALLDGQHRLFAVVEAGITVPMIVLEGLDEDVMDTIDTGASRTYADYLVAGKRTGGNANYVQAVARLWFWYERVRPGTLGSVTPTFAELDEVMKEHPEIADRVREVGNMKMAKRLMSASGLMFVYDAAYQSNPTLAQMWLHTIDTGDAGVNDPAKVLRDRMVAAQIASASKGKLDRMQQLILIIKSWNAYSSNQALKRLVVGETDMPEIRGLQVNHRPMTASGAPRKRGRVRALKAGHIAKGAKPNSHARKKAVKG